MSSVQNKNFEVSAPDTSNGTATSVKIYHEKYSDAVKEVAGHMKWEW